MAHGFCSIFTQHTAKQQRSFAHTASPDKIQHGYPNLDNHHQSFGSWSIARVNVSWLSWALDCWAQLSQDTLTRAIDQLPKDWWMLSRLRYPCWILSGLAVCANDRCCFTVCWVKIEQNPCTIAKFGVISRGVNIYANLQRIFKRTDMEVLHSFLDKIC